MNRYKYALSLQKITEQIIGLFPYGTLIDPENTHIQDEQISFFEDSDLVFAKLKEKNFSVMLFINQFKQHPIAFEELKKFTEAVESYIRQKNVKVAGMYWAPGHDKKDPFVVPNPGMFYRATEQTGIKWDDVIVLSANDTDLSAANKVKAHPVKIGTPNAKMESHNSLLEWIDKQ